MYSPGYLLLFVVDLMDQCSDRPKNELVLLNLQERNSYGYELMEQAAASGIRGINPGTLYKTLRQMEPECCLRIDLAMSREVLLNLEGL